VLCVLNEAGFVTSKNWLNTMGSEDQCFFCLEPAVEVCSHCNLAGICDIADHKKIHKPDDVCFPFHVEKRPGVGNIMVASRDIQPAELVLYDSAACVGPRMWSPPVCLQCLKPLTSDYRCTKCRWPLCGPKCENGTRHQIECNIFASSSMELVFPNNEDANNCYKVVAPLRLAKIIRDSKSIGDRVSRLMDHNEDRRKDEKLWNIYQMHINRYLDSCESSDFTDEELDRATGLLWTNSFACASGGGQAIFPVFSLISHSCISNCSHSVYPNNHLGLQAKTFIPKGEELTISYISPNQGKQRRREKLLSKWYFLCNCPRCLDPAEFESHCSTLLCQVPLGQQDHRCLGLVMASSGSDVEADWNCRKCGNASSPADIVALETKLALEMRDALSLSLAHLEDQVEDMEKLLHQNHYLLLLAKRHLIGAYGINLEQKPLEVLRRRKQLCEEALAVWNIIDPGLTKDRGSLLKDLSVTKKLILKRDLVGGLISDEEFSKEVQHCVELFNESQECVLMRVKRMFKK